MLGQISSKLASEEDSSICYEDLGKSSPIEPVVLECSQACLGSGVSTSSLQDDGLLEVCSKPTTFRTVYLLPSESLISKLSAPMV